MTKAELKKKYRQLRQLRDKTCNKSEDLQVQSAKLKKEATVYKDVTLSINATLDRLEELF